MAQNPLQELDAAFELPEAMVANERLRGLYEVLVARMRNEARNLPMNTVQQLLIERIATNYIVLKAREAGEGGGFTTTAGQKDYNTFWLSMTQEFNRMLGRADAKDDRAALLREMQTIIVNTLATTIADPRQRRMALEKMATAMEKAGVGG
jgi:hypothetical protein